MIVTPTKYERIREKYRIWLVAWVELLESIIKILSFGLIYPNWSFTIVCNITINDMKKKKEENERPKPNH